MSRQGASLKVALIRNRNNIEKFTCRNHRYYIDFESWINVELSTSNWCHPFHMDLPFMIDKMSTDVWRRISVSNRWWIDEDMSIGSEDLKEPSNKKVMVIFLFSFCVIIIWQRESKVSRIGNRVKNINLGKISPGLLSRKYGTWIQRCLARNCS